MVRVSVEDHRSDALVRDRIADLEQIALARWTPDDCDERRWQSEERRLAILKAGLKVDWQKESPPVPHPLKSSGDSPIDNVRTD